MLAFRRDEVDALNLMAREAWQQAREFGREEMVKTAVGIKPFAEGE